MNMQKNIESKLMDLLQTDFPVQSGDIQFSIPPDRKMGDLSTTLPFILAKRTGDKPFEIGRRILERIEDKFDFFSHIQIAGGGFLNFFFDKDFLLTHMLAHREKRPEDQDDKVIVEHTSINPNKSAHIGHLRNACLGDALVRSLRYLGHRVEIQNYIDDTGIQVADVVWGLLHHKKMVLPDIEKIENLSVFLWNLYSEVHRILGDDEALVEERKEVHRRIEEKIDPEYEVGDYIAQQVLKDHIRVMDEIGIRYDLLVRESDIIELDFFDMAAGLLKERGVLYQSDDPQKSGCWVIKYHHENIEKIVVRSNGTVTYIGKDIAYTLWKVGLLDGDFRYRDFFSYPDGHTIYTSDARHGEDRPGFGDGVRVYNVIDTRQSYLQNIISQVLDSLAGNESGRKFIHFSYEMVALTPRCVKEMGFHLSPDDEKKTYVEVSGRKGIAIKADDLISKLSEKSLEEVRLRHPEMEDRKARTIARDIAIGALRYFMIKFNSKSVIAFDFKDALAFEGDTGPYLQYTVVRLNSIFKKLGSAGLDQTVEGLKFAPLEEAEAAIFYDILLHLMMMDNQIAFAIDSDELSIITSYIYTLCQKINHYYHLYPIVSEKRPEVKNLRIALILLVKAKLEILLDLVGIPIPEKM